MTYLYRLFRDVRWALLAIAVVVGLISRSLFAAALSVPIDFAVVVATYEWLWRRDMRQDGDVDDQQLLDMMDELKHIHEESRQGR